MACCTVSYPLSGTVRGPPKPLGPLSPACHPQPGKRGFLCSSSSLCGVARVQQGDLVTPPGHCRLVIVAELQAKHIAHGLEDDGFVPSSSARCAGRGWAVGMCRCESRFSAGACRLGEAARVKVPVAGQARAGRVSAEGLVHVAEAHTAMLVRCVRDRMDPDLLCVGTSATMATEGSAASCALLTSPEHAFRSAPAR